MTVRRPPAAQSGEDLEEFLPTQIRKLLRNPQTDLPRIAKNLKLTALIESVLPGLPTRHDLYRQDARDGLFVPPESVHVALTSPPYWTLKEYRRTKG